MDIVGNKIVAAVNEKMGLKLTIVNHEDAILCKDDKGRRWLIIYNDNSHVHGYYVKGVLRQRRNVRSFRYIFNGQAGTGAEQMGFWNEGDFTVQLTREEWEAKMDGYNPDWRKYESEHPGTFRMPMYLEELASVPRG